MPKLIGMATGPTNWNDKSERLGNLRDVLAGLGDRLDQSKQGPPCIDGKIYEVFINVGVVRGTFSFLAIQSGLRMNTGSPLRGAIVP